MRHHSHPSAGCANHGPKHQLCRDPCCTTLGEHSRTTRTGASGDSPWFGDSNFRLWWSITPVVKSASPLRHVWSQESATAHPGRALKARKGPAWWR